MNFQRISRLCVAAAVVSLSVSFGFDIARAAPPDPAAGEEGIEVLTRGPVHEAFAETVTFDPEPGIVVPKAPPESIEELPPDQRPEGDNVAWIPGYWAWDDERGDFLWVSGVWRALPPGRQWESGYWGQSGDDFQWTSGYWADAEASEVEYLPQPPETVEVGPNIAAPSANHTWLPGCWIWQNLRYAWRPGYWATARTDWVWIPGYYVWAPRGYVFVDGYWDYSISRRGVLFAPVYFAAHVYARSGFFYSPTAVINPAVFGAHLFLRPRYGHYYFGDYYAANYSTAGYYPWFSFHNNRSYRRGSHRGHQHGYDPFYAYDRWRHRGDRKWELRVQADFRNLRDHVDARPPRTWAAQTTIAASSGKKDFAVAAPLEGFASGSDGAPRLRPVDEQERRMLAQRSKDVNRSRLERQNREKRVAAASANPNADETGPARVKLPRSPIVAKTADQLGEGLAPPAPHTDPVADRTIGIKSKKRGRNLKQAEAARFATEGQRAADAPMQRKAASNFKPPQAGEQTAGIPPTADIPKPIKPARNRRPPQAGQQTTGDPQAADVPKRNRGGGKARQLQADQPVFGNQPTPGVPKRNRGGGKARQLQADQPVIGNQPTADVPKRNRGGGKLKGAQAEMMPLDPQSPSPDASQAEPKKKHKK